MGSTDLLKRIHRLTAGFVFGLLLIGCSTVETLTGPDGSTHHLIQCSEVRLCYEKALEVCKGPYEIVNSTTQVNGAPQGWTVSEQQLLIKCKVDSSTDKQGVI